MLVRSAKLQSCNIQKAWRGAVGYRACNQWHCVPCWLPKRTLTLSTLRAVQERKKESLQGRAGTALPVRALWTCTLLSTGDISVMSQRFSTNNGSKVCVFSVWDFFYHVPTHAKTKVSFMRKSTCLMLQKNPLHITVHISFCQKILLSILRREVKTY